MQIDPLVAYGLAAEKLLQIGFKLHSCSMLTESQYFVWPGYEKTLRLSLHQAKNKHPEHLPIAGKLTFTVPLGEVKLEKAIATAIGMYFLKGNSQ